MNSRSMMSGLIVSRLPPPCQVIYGEDKRQEEREREQRECKSRVYRTHIQSSKDKKFMEMESEDVVHFHTRNREG